MTQGKRIGKEVRAKMLSILVMQLQINNILLSMRKEIMEELRNDGK